MFKKLIFKLKDFWRRLTWCHVISVPKNSDAFEDGEWYAVSYFISKRGKEILVDDVRITKISEEDVFNVENVG